MPGISITFGPFASLYIGPHGGVGVLQEIVAPRGNGSRVREWKEKEFKRVAGKAVPKSFMKLRAQLNFIGLDDDVLNLARGKALGTARNTNAADAKYSILLLHPFEDDITSVYIPECYSTAELDVPQEKSADSIMPITFEMEGRTGAYLCAFDTHAALDTLLGARSPL